MTGKDGGIERHPSMPLLEPLPDLEPAKPVAQPVEPVGLVPGSSFLDNNYDAHQRAIKVAVEAAARHNAALAAAKAAKQVPEASSVASAGAASPLTSDSASEVHQDAVAAAQEAARLRALARETLAEQARQASEDSWPCDDWGWAWGCEKQGPFLVFIEGIPEAICASPTCMSAMFQQAGLKNHLVSFEVPDPASGEVWVCLSNWEAMQCCLWHFRGCLWAQVTASAVSSSPHIDDPSTCEEQPASDSARDRACWADLSDEAEEDLPVGLRRKKA